ncbi:MAG: hypothetical protein Aurels2KO_32590 [Aureliella sp.]
MTGKFTINETNYLDADSAVSDILFMFRDMITSYRGFARNIASGSYDTVAYMKVEIVQPAGVTYSLDQELLETNAGIACLCSLVNAWDEGDHRLVPQHLYFTRVRNALDHGAAAKYQPIRLALTAGLQKNDEMRTLLPPVYETYVVGYLQKLINDATKPWIGRPQ